MIFFPIRKTATGVILPFFLLLALTGASTRKEKVAEGKTEKEETDEHFLIKDVQIEQVPVMTASSDHYRIFWTMEEVSGEGKGGDSEAGLASEPSPPLTFSLSQNYPNPFNPSTTIRFTVPDGEEGQTTLQIYDIRGRLIRNLINKELVPGKYSTHWDGRTDRGEAVSSGVYLYKLRHGERIQTRKMTVVR